MEYVYRRILLLLFIANVVRSDGEPSKSTEIKITSGNESHVRWASFIYVEGNYCSGVVVTTYFVISSRLCYNKYYEAKSSIYLGGGKYKSFFDLYSHNVQKHRILHLITSDELAEIMLVESRTQFKFSHNVNRVSITSEAQFENSKKFSCLFAGFGIRTQYDTPGQLTTQEFHVYTGDDCEPQGSQLFNNRSSMICTKPSVGDNFGLCPGDYGGGLVCNNVLVGIAHSTVYALKNETLCGRKVEMNLFTYVGSLANFIEQEVQKHTKAILQNPQIEDRLATRSGADKWLPEMIMSLATYFICLFTIS